MLKEPSHLSDQEILLVLDGEVSKKRAQQARAHLAACESCRSRLGELDGAIADLISLRRSTLDPQLPDAAGARALLKARLAEARRPSSGPGPRFLHFLPLRRAAACICVAIFLSMLGARFLLRHSQLHAAAAVPDHNLTPGATRPISIGEVCSMTHEEVVRDVPGFLRQQVFEEYGISNPRPGDYEIDYLIAPGLGGAEDIHNLWPEPSTSSTWNAHVKDALEERLHQLVCNGKLDLPTAQKAIATDWITAYKKYLGGDRYVSRSALGAVRAAGWLAG